MKVVVMEGVGSVVVKDMEIPQISDDEVLVKIQNSNICTTDWQTWAGLRGAQGRKFPWAPGHEMAGEIVEVGAKVLPRLKVGMHVALGAPGSLGCGECVFCREGHPSRCMFKPKEPTRHGITGSFGMAQYFVANPVRVYPVADDLSFAEACYMEPVSTAVHGCKRLRVRPGDHVLVIGAGNLGLVNAQVARSYGGRVIVSEIDEKRVALARLLGFETVNPSKVDLAAEVKKLTGAKGADVVILAAASSKANAQGLEALTTRGRMLFFSAGYPEPEFQVRPNQLHYREWELIGTWGADPSDYEVAARLLGDRLVQVDKLLSYTVPVDEAQRAFELAATPGNYRVSLKMW